MGTKHQYMAGNSCATRFAIRVQGEMISTGKLINIVVTTQSCKLCVVRTRSINSLSKFQVYNTTLLTGGGMAYSTTLEPFLPHNQSLYLSTSPSPGTAATRPLEPAGPTTVTWRRARWAVTEQNVLQVHPRGRAAAFPSFFRG